MNPTKHVKTIDVIDHPYTVQEIRTEYRCPCCMTTFYNGGPSKRVKVFVCDCGQELKVRNRLPPPIVNPNVIPTMSMKKFTATIV